ncbi:MAG: SDR family NAD(P)-dependent oxidoreductase [Myxococcota bacterium]
MSLVSWVKGRRGASGFGYASTATEVTEGLDLTGLTFAITGVNSGLGAETARVLHRRGARVIGLARTVAKARAAVDTFFGGDADPWPVACELSEPDAIVACTDTLRDVTLDGIICNAGIMALPRRELVHGVERQFFTNHVGHFMLVTRLLEQLSDRARVVMVSSAAHAWAPEGGIAFDDLAFNRDYRPNRAYGQSKLANLLFAKALAQRFDGSERRAFAVHPGVIATNLGRHLGRGMQALMPLGNALAFKTVGQGAATSSYAAAHPDAAHHNGAYFVDCNVATPSRHARDADLAERLWRTTEAIVDGF